jgi:hypothetical protein
MDLAVALPGQSGRNGHAGPGAKAESAKLAALQPAIAFGEQPNAPTTSAPALWRCFHSFFHLRVTQVGECRF